MKSIYKLITARATLWLTACALLGSTMAKADGLIHSLPKDGASVTYKFEMTIEVNGMKRTAGGDLVVASVGKSKVGADDCRWIEIGMTAEVDGQQRTTIAKLLIPEKQLAQGKSPIDHVKKAWVKMDDREPRQIEDVKSNQGGPLPMFLCGPATDAKKLKAIAVETKNGKLECAGIEGSRMIKQGDEEIEIKTTTRLNDKVPFGVAATTLRLNVVRGGKRTITIKMTGAEIGKDAKSVLPDLK